VTIFSLVNKVQSL